MTEVSERLHVYEVPEKLNDGYTFAGPKQIIMLNVDWFDSGVATRDEVVEFIKKKKYYRKDKRFLVIGETSAWSFTIDVNTVVPFRRP